jgi:hypothetical protein
LSALMSAALSSSSIGFLFYIINCLTKKIPI